MVKIQNNILDDCLHLGCTAYFTVRETPLFAQRHALLKRDHSLDSLIVISDKNNLVTEATLLIRFSENEYLLKGLGRAGVEKEHDTALLGSLKRRKVSLSMRSREALRVEIAVSRDDSMPQLARILEER